MAITGSTTKNHPGTATVTQTIQSSVSESQKQKNDGEPLKVGKAHKGRWQLFQDLAGKTCSHHSEHNDDAENQRTRCNDFQRHPHRSPVAFDISPGEGNDSSNT